jgi:hypothetical protein
VRRDSCVPAEASVCEREPGPRGDTTGAECLFRYCASRFSRWVHASRVYPTCVDLIADLGQARDRCLVPLAQARSLHSSGTRGRCDAASSCERSVERAADAVRSLPQPKSDLSDFGQLRMPNSGKPEFGRGRVGVGACMHECSSMLCTSLSVCPLPVPPPQAGEGTLEPLVRSAWRGRKRGNGRDNAPSAAQPARLVCQVAC